MPSRMRTPGVTLLAVPILLVASLAHAAETGAVDIRSQPAGANISVDGVSVGVAPQLVALPAGTHTIRLTLPGYRPEVQQVKVGRTGISRLYVRLVRAAGDGLAAREGLEGDPRAGMGMVVVVTTPDGLRVLIDGTPVDQTTPLAVDLKPGSHTLSIVRGKQALFSTTIALKAGEKIKLKRDLRAEAQAIERAERRAGGDDEPGAGRGGGARPGASGSGKSGGGKIADDGEDTSDRDAVAGGTKRSKRCACGTRARLSACVAKKRACTLRGLGGANDPPYAVCRSCPQIRRLRGAKRRTAEAACDTRSSRSDDCVCRDIARVLRDCIDPYLACFERCRGE